MTSLETLQTRMTAYQDALSTLRAYGQIEPDDILSADWTEWHKQHTALLTVYHAERASVSNTVHNNLARIRTMPLDRLTQDDLLTLAYAASLSLVDYSVDWHFTL